MEKLLINGGIREKNVTHLNEDVEIINIVDGKYGKKVQCKCIRCGNEWIVSIRSYMKNPSCPKCRPKQTPKEGCGKKISQEEWISRAKAIHPEYMYDKTEYHNSNKSVIIICPKHGEFSVNPKAFLKPNYECAKCKKERIMEGKNKKVIEFLIKKFPLLDFSKSVYKGKKEKMLVGGYPDGERWVSAYNLLRNECPRSRDPKNYKNPRAFSFEEFLEMDKKVHKENDFLMLKEDFKGMSVPMKMKCNRCGYEFYRKPKDHILGNGCRRCLGRYNFTTNEIIEEFKKVHGDKYDYSKVEYINMNTKVCIICNEKDEFGRLHGEFWQTPKIHLKGFGCKKCSKSYMDADYFILKANSIHNNKYNYSKVDYKNNHTKVCITCPEHGEFWQTPLSHLSGRGCPVCNDSHIERALMNILENNNIEYIFQYRDKEILGKQSLDFFLPQYRLAIECQSEIHYKDNFFKDKREDYSTHLKYRQEMDEQKRNICKINEIRLIYFMEKKFINLETSDIPSFYKEEDILTYIQNMQH